jgi:hypothetical protein
MHSPVLWLGGWASGLACWRAPLEALYPRREHTFLDAHAVLEEPGLLALAAAGLPKDGTLVAWSLGSLLLHRALADGLTTDCRRVSVSPIFDFCAAGGPPRAALKRMMRRLPRERETVLAEFWDLIRGNSAVTPAQEQAWRAQARAYPLASLLQGLEALDAVAVDRKSLFREGGDNRHRFLASPLDPMAPAPREAFPGRGWNGYAAGHLPFLDYAAALTPLLDGKDPADASGRDPR